MEGKEENNISSRVAVKGDEAPDSFRVAPRNENPAPFSAPAATLATAEASPTPVSMAAPASGSGTPSGLSTGTGTSVGTGAGTGTDMKKKRGRPRKYGPDGTVTMALSPMPISASIPLTGEYSAWKRGRGRPLDSIKKNKYEYESPGKRNISGDNIAYFVGANFTPHVLTVNIGEDVTMKVMSFSQQGSRAICILSANGTISNVTLRQPTSSGGTLTYEGRFEILSLSGSFTPSDNGGTKSRSGGMSVSLAGPDGRVVGGGLAGFLIAAGPVQVVVGSFLPGHQQEQKHKKQKTELAPVVKPMAVSVISAEEVNGGFSAVKPIVTSSSFHRENSASLNPMLCFRNLATDNKTSLEDEDSKGPTQSNCEVSC